MFSDWSLWLSEKLLTCSPRSSMVTRLGAICHSVSAMTNCEGMNSVLTHVLSCNDLEKSETALSAPWYLWVVPSSQRKVVCSFPAFVSALSATLRSVSPTLFFP